MQMFDTNQWPIDALKDTWKLLSTTLFELNGAKISFSSILAALAILLLTFRVAAFAGRLVNGALAKKSVDSGVRDSLERVTRYVMIGLGVLISLDTLGFTISSLAALGAVLMVGIGFGLQNIAQNFISGIILLVERPVKVGDIIQAGSTTGRVMDIRVRSTVIQTRDDVSIIVPNSKLIAEDVVNESYMGQRIRRKVRVGVAYGSNLEQVRNILLELALQHEKILKDPEPAVGFADFGESSLDFELYFWTNEIWLAGGICSDLRFAIEAAFRHYKIEIPFPQRELMIKGQLPKA
jgi:small-conductance mechanosensitive channel